MRRRYHLASNIYFGSEVSSDDRTGLEPAIIAAIRRAVESAASASRGTVFDDLESSEASLEVFSAERYQSSRDTYAIPSYDEGGRLHELPVEESHEKGGDVGSVASVTTWTPNDIAAHLIKTFGTYAPRGQTYYGVQTPDGLLFGDTENGKPVFRIFNFQNYKKDVKDHWEITEALSYPKGRFTFTVTGRGDGNGPFPNIASVTDFQGKQYGSPVYTPLDPGLRIVFDVPETIQPGEEAGGGGSRFGTGIMNRGSGGALILLKCHGSWDTNPLTDPAYAGSSDDDYWRLFLNLCNARAIDNLEISEKYIREELVPRYVGPLGSTKSLSNYSRHNVQHFQEDLQLLRGLMLASNRLWADIHALQAELDPLVMTHHRTSRQFRAPFGFGAGLTADIAWPTYHEPAEADRPRVEFLTGQLKGKGQSARIVMAGILKLVQQDPLLTQFVTGLDLRSNVASAPDREAIGSELADISSAEAAQQKILTKLNELLHSIARAKHKLCLDPERILDVPLVYEAVQTMVQGINLRFDQVAQERIAAHHRQEAWIDIGLSAAGLVLFVGGLIISLFGGPAGVVLFLEITGTVLGAITAARSIDKAEFLTSASEASVTRGGGLVTLEAASDARFWATVDAVLLAVDAGAQALKLARAAASSRKATALAKLSKGAEQFGESAEAARSLPFDDLLRQAAPHGKLPVSEAELSALQSLGTQIQDMKVAGRIAEEAAERAISSSGEYVQLATKFQQGGLMDVGIDLLYARRKIFEEAFGKLANPRDASKVLAQATEQQRQRFFQALRKSANSEDLISFEVKFSKSGAPIEELLKTARGGIQQNTAWYGELMTHMIKSADPDVQATGRLLQEIIGTTAQDLGRLSRIGIVVDSQGAFKLQKLSDQVIELAQRSKAIYQQKSYWGMAAGLLEAERKGNQVRAQKLRALLTTMNNQINTLDAAVKQAKQAEAASERALASMRRASETLGELSALSAKPQTPAIVSSLHLATATARLHLQVVKHSAEEADADFQRANKIIAEANNKYQEIERATNAAFDELERSEQAKSNSGR
jgi:hypothetical protein